MPFLMKMTSPQFSFEIQIDSVEQNIDIPSEKFEFPDEIQKTGPARHKAIKVVETSFLWSVEWNDWYVIRYASLADYLLIE